VPRALDATALQWLRPSEMAGLPMPPADEPLIPMLAALL
jgi:8-oxo-dGTP diphosphatase